MKSKLKLLVVSLLVTAFAMSFGYRSQSSDKVGEQLKVEYEDFLRVASIQGEKMSSIDVFRAKYSENEYAGMYFEGAKLTICLMANDKQKEKKAEFIKSLDEDIKILYFKYSEEEIVKEIEKLAPFIDGDKYFGAYKDVKKNALVIQTKVDLTYEEVKKECGIALDEEHVIFEKMHPEGKLVTTAYVRSGTEATANGQDFTIGFGGAGASYL